MGREFIDFINSVKGKRLLEKGISVFQVSEFWAMTNNKEKTSAKAIIY